MARLPASKHLYSLVMARKDLGVVYTCLQGRQAQACERLVVLSAHAAGIAIHKRSACFQCRTPTPTQPPYLLSAA